MKTQTLTGLLLLTLSTSIFAVGHYPACRPIVLACKAAGFTKGGAPGQNLFKDCIRPILQNQPATGSIALPTVNPADVAACNVQKAQGQLQQLQSTTNSQQPVVNQQPPITNAPSQQ